VAFLQGLPHSPESSKVTRLAQALERACAVAPVFSWLALSKTIVIWPSRIAQLESSNAQAGDYLGSTLQIATEQLQRVEPVSEGQCVGRIALWQHAVRAQFESSLAGTSSGRLIVVVEQGAQAVA
jgi:hypothetical protein